MNRAIIWTPEIDSALLNFRAAGLSMSECSRRIGISLPVLARRCRELDIHIRSTRWTAAMDAQLRELRSQGLSWPIVGRRLGVSADAAHCRGRRLNLDTTRRPVWNIARDMLLRRLRAEGVGWRRVSREIGLSTHACRIRSVKLGIPKTAMQVAFEVGHPPNTAAVSIAASVPSPPKPGRAGHRTSGAASFEGNVHAR